MGILEEAACSASKMTTHDGADKQVAAFKERWVSVHETTKEWVASMTTLVECWNKLDGNVGELSSWVNTKDSAAPEGKSEISIEKLESQLNRLLLLLRLLLPRLQLLLQKRLPLNNHLKYF